MSKFLPTLDCQTCGNFEQTVLKNECIKNFCYKFYQNVKPTEINPSCWTTEKTKYHQQILFEATKKEKKAFHLNEQRKQQLQLNFD